MNIIKHWFYFIPLISFGSLLIIAIIKSSYSYTFGNIIIKKRNVMPIIIIGSYFISSVAVIFVDTKNWFPFFVPTLFTPINFFLYSFILLLFLFPSLNIKPLTHKDKLPSKRAVTLLMFGMSILGCYAVIYQFPYALKAFRMNARYLRVALRLGDYCAFPNTPATTLAVGISYFNMFYLVFYFLSVIQRRNFILRFSLLIASLSYVVSSLAFAARDGLLFYIINFTFTYYFFKNLLSLKSRRQIKLLFLVFIFLMTAILSLFTTQRFTTGQGIASGLIGYIGQQPYVFSVTVNKQSKFYHGDLRFPFFKSFYSKPNPVKRRKNYEWMFGTFIKDLYAANGFPFLIISTFALVLFFYFKIKEVNYKKFSRRIIIVFFYYQFMTQGLFYFRMGHRPGNIYIFILFLIFLSTYFRYSRMR